MQEFGFGAFIATMQSALTWFAQKALAVLIIVVAITAVYPILPDDPFRSDILTIKGTMQQWSDFINWFIPAPFIVSSVQFAILCKIFYYLYHLYMSALGLNFLKIFTNISYSDGQYVNSDGEIL